MRPLVASGVRLVFDYALSTAETRPMEDRWCKYCACLSLNLQNVNTRWIFSETRNSSNPASHCDIAWAGALATYAHTSKKNSIGAAVGYDSCWFDGRTYHPYQQTEPLFLTFHVCNNVTLQPCNLFLTFHVSGLTHHAPAFVTM